MGGEASKRLSIMAKLSALSVKHGKLNNKNVLKSWLETGRDLDSFTEENGGNIDLVLRMIEEQRVRKAKDKPTFSELTVVKKKKF